MCGPLCASADVIFNLQDSICLPLFMCPGVASNPLSTLTVCQKCMEPLVLLWLPSLLSLAARRHLPSTTFWMLGHNSQEWRAMLRRPTWRTRRNLVRKCEGLFFFFFFGGLSPHDCWRQVPVPIAPISHQSCMQRALWPRSARTPTVSGTTQP